MFLMTGEKVREPKPWRTSEDASSFKPKRQPLKVGIQIIQKSVNNIYKLWTEDVSISCGKIPSNIHRLQSQTSCLSISTKFLPNPFNTFYAYFYNRNPESPQCSSFSSQLMWGETETHTWQLAEVCTKLLPWMAAALHVIWENILEIKCWMNYK